ncbi:hypothetical protein CONLIGDRAFT_647881 [Coniochaeta ligniaria NRRL 30616]|uniref:Uncharacterized protein n=1 Tax=Coniochaeta ligniaria NRRL 30616 TaxID=1408157 RepID=A0A1J7IFW7_9PEZI|nr:hypothetical protein CONLIGDRAFT_647881 [Coniochaeta ligniaria NRRL 30616]
MRRVDQTMRYLDFTDLFCARLAEEITVGSTGPRLAPEDSRSRETEPFMTGVRIILGEYRLAAVPFSPISFHARFGEVSTAAQHKKNGGHVRSDTKKEGKWRRGKWNRRIRSLRIQLPPTDWGSHRCQATSGSPRSDVDANPGSLRRRNNCCRRDVSLSEAISFHVLSCHSRIAKQTDDALGLGLADTPDFADVQAT